MKSGSLGFGDMFKPLTSLQYCHYMFYNCDGLNCAIPDGLLSNCTKLKQIDGMFQSCNNLPTLPKSLFRVSSTSTNTFPDLTLARNVFADCSSMTGIVDINFFNGANNLTDISGAVNTTIHLSNNYYPTRGFFANTKLTGYFEEILNPLTKLTNCGRLFYNDSANTPATLMITISSIYSTQKAIPPMRQYLHHFSASLLFWRATS
jgi:hypothetical protein